MAADASSSKEAEAVDAFRQVWAKGERVWAHPPVELLDPLAALLASDERLSEVAVSGQHAMRRSQCIPRSVHR